MKLSQYIAGLQKFLEENGDVDAYYAADDEGNAYQSVSYTGSLFYLTEYDKERWRPDLVSGSDTEHVSELQEDGVELIPVCVVN